MGERTTGIRIGLIRSVIGSIRSIKLIRLVIRLIRSMGSIVFTVRPFSDNLMIKTSQFDRQQ